MTEEEACEIAEGEVDAAVVMGGIIARHIDALSQKIDILVQDNFQVRHLTYIFRIFPQRPLFFLS